MILAKRFSPYALGFLVTAGLILAEFVPALTWIGYLFLIAVTFVSIWILFDKKFSREFFNGLIVPFLFLCSAILLSLFLGNIYIKVLFPFLIGFLLFIYTEQLFYYRYWPQRYQSGAIENTTFYLVVLSFFFLAASLFGFYIFLHAPKLLLIFAVTIVTVILNYQLFWVMKVNFWETWPYNAVLTLVIFEAFYVLTFLPAGFIVSATILSVLYYFALGLLRYHFMDRLETKIIKRYLFVAGTMFLFVVLTARWT